MTYQGVLCLLLAVYVAQISAWHKGPGFVQYDTPGVWGGGRRPRGEFHTLIPGFLIPGVRIRGFVEDGQFPDYGFEGPRDRLGFMIRGRFEPASKWSGIKAERDEPDFHVNGKYMHYRMFRRAIQDYIYWRKHRDFKIRGMPDIEIVPRSGIPPFYVKGEVEVPGFTSNGLFPALKYFRGEPRFHVGGRTWVPAFRFPGFQDKRGVGGFEINGRFVPYLKLHEFLTDWFRSGKGLGELKIKGFSLKPKEKYGVWPGFNIKGIEIPGFAPNGVFPAFEYRNNVPGFVIGGTFKPANEFPGFKLSGESGDEPGFSFDGDFVRYDRLKDVIESYATSNFEPIKKSIPGFTINPTNVVDFPGYLVKGGVPGFNLGGRFVPGYKFPGFDIKGSTPGFNIPHDEENFVPLNDIPELHPDFKVPKPSDGDKGTPLTDEEKQAGEVPAWNNGITASTGKLTIGPAPTATIDYPGYKVKDGQPGFMVDNQFLAGNRISNFVIQGGLPGFTIKGNFVPLTELKAQYPNFHFQLPPRGDISPDMSIQGGVIGFTVGGKFIPGNQFPGIKAEGEWPRVKVPGFKIPGYESEVPEFTIKDFQPGFLVENGEKFIPGLQVEGYHQDGMNISLEGAHIPTISFPGFSFELGLPIIGLPE